MAEWTRQELEAAASDDNLYISIPNSDGTMHKPTWIWAVQAGGTLYARGGSGVGARWFQSAKAIGYGHVSIGGVEKDVNFEFPEDKETNDAVDRGYELKYEGSPYVEYMREGNQRAATVRFVPAE